MLSFVRHFLVIGILITITGTGFAQTSKGTIIGTVRDSTGAVIGNASVSMRQEATGFVRKTTTNSDGVFRADAVEPGPYTVHIESTGFKIYDLQHLNVVSSIPTSTEIVLSVASASQQVVVEAANAATLDTDSGQLANTINLSELQAVPVFSLNLVELVQTLPGVQLVNNGGFSNGFNVSVNGGRPRGNNYLIDGQDDNDNGIAGQALQTQIPDMFSSVTALTNAYSAEFGRAGGAVVNLITKGGTNQFHGSAWELYQGSGLNAIDGQNRGVPGYSKARFDQHNFGFTAGGPVIHDKLFLFGASQWERFYGNAVPGNIALPTDQDTIKLGNGSTTSSYSYLQSLAATNPNAALLMRYIGALDQYTLISPQGDKVTLINEPNCTSCQLNFYTYKRPNLPQQNTDTQWTVRGDYQVTTEDHLAVRFLHDKTFLSPDLGNFPDQLPGFDSDQDGTASQTGAEYTHVFSPSVINEFRASATRIDFAFSELPSTIANPLYALPIVSVANTGLPALGPATDSLPQGRGHDFYQFQDTVSWTRGKHTLRIGADIGRVIVRDFIPFNNFGTLTYENSTGYSALNNYLDNFLGAGGTGTINFGSNRVDSHQWQTAYFAQDDIKLTPDFTLNLGLRYEFQTNPENAVAFPAINAATVLTDPINKLYKVAADKNNIAPRIGFAWNPHLSTPYLADGKTVYHAAFGIFYDVLFTNITDNSQASAPNAQAPEVISTTGRGAPNANSIIPSLAPSPVIGPTNSVELTTNNLVNPQTYEWNLGIERQLPGETKLTVNYVGTRGEKLFANQQYNYFDPSTGLRLNPARGAIVARGNFADSMYHGLQVGVTHDLRHGIFLQGSYTYSKNLDDGSEIFNFSNPFLGSPTTYSANLAPGHRGQDWGPSAYDFRHYLALTYIWQIPAMRNIDNRALNALLEAVTRQWEFSGTSLFQSGQYSTFNLSGFDTNLDGSTANDRPLLGNKRASYESIGIAGSALGCPNASTLYDLGANNVSGACNPVNASDVHWIVPYPYTAGDVAQEIGRDSFENPGYWTFNWAAQKGFGLKIKGLEGASLVLRAETSNVFNHNNVGPLNINLLQAAPGAGDPFMNRNLARFDDERQLRLWAKFVF